MTTSLYQSAERTKRMSTIPAVPPLRDGDRLTQTEFHRRYLAYPEDVKAELIGGIVYIASPLRRPHGIYHPVLSYALCHYQGVTPGVEVLDNATAILGPASEPQPDLALRILPEWGGRTHTAADDYVCGGSELFAETAHSTQALDLGPKRVDYQEAGVLEYIVLCIEPLELHWFDLQTGQPIKPNRQGVYRSRVFPGLWLDREALFNRDTLRLLAVLQEGLASRAHATFIKRLQAAHRKLTGG